jgi:D-alanine-D-alanine ligase
MQKKLRVAVITGGPSSEHEVSVSTGKMVLRYLSRKLYVASEVRINKNGQWQFLPQRKHYGTSVALSEVKRNFDIAFIALHGRFGEDGSLQALFARKGIPFTGSGPSASKLAMDKVASDRVFRKVGLTVPRSAILKKGQKLPIHFTFPVVVKPVRGGSSIGISIVHSQKQLPAAIRRAFSEDKEVMLQQFVTGRELTCSVLEKGGKPVVLTPTEIIPKIADFFDYKAKYQKGGSREITPPRLSKSWINKIKSAALTAHRIFGCRGLSRTDFIIFRKTLYVLEINTIPGMTPTSLLPQEARHDGYSFSTMLDIIIQAALRRF